MATETKTRRHDLVPLSDLELQTLRLWTDRDFSFWQHKPDPPAEIVRLRERLLAGGQPPTKPPVVTTAPAGNDEKRQPGWADELLRLEVRVGAVVLAIVVGLILAVSSVAATVLVP